MKSNLVLLLTLLFASIDCNDNSKRKKSMEEDVHPSDSACKAEIATAKSEIKKEEICLLQLCWEHHFSILKSRK